MREILCWGEPAREFKRLGIEPHLTHKGTDIIVFELSEEAFQKLCDDSEHPWPVEAECGWRYTEGSNLGDVDRRANINGRHLRVWSRGQSLRRRYESLIQYLEYAVGATTESNVAACLADLAKQNGLKISELLSKYQLIQKENA